MSISAVTSVVQAHQEAGQPPAISPAPGVTPFGQQLDDAQTNQTLASQGHRHHHHGADSQSATGTPASTTGAASSSGSLASSLLNLLS
jgi:hypothetical protein